MKHASTACSSSVANRRAGLGASWCTDGTADRATGPVSLVDHQDGRHEISDVLLRATPSGLGVLVIVLAEGGEAEFLRPAELLSVDRARAALLPAGQFILSPVYGRDGWREIASAICARARAVECESRTVTGLLRRLSRYVGFCYSPRGNAGLAVAERRPFARGGHFHVNDAQFLRFEDDLLRRPRWPRPVRLGPARFLLAGFRRTIAGGAWKGKWYTARYWAAPLRLVRSRVAL